jgi:prepilin-type N-terminal cleavage/methylation domain-containing protein
MNQINPGTRFQNPKSKIQNRFEGFTLVELLVVVVIFGGIMGALLISFLTGQSTYFSADAYIQAQQEARRSLDTMIRELRESRGTAGQERYYIPAANTVVFQVPTDTDNDGDVIDGTGAVEWGPGVVLATGCIQYTVVGNQIQRTQLAGPMNVGAQTCGGAVGTARVLANSVTGLTFTFLAPRSMTIAVTTQENARVTGGQRSYPMTLSGRVQFRN